MAKRETEPSEYTYDDYLKDFELDHLGVGMEGLEITEGRPEDAKAVVDFTTQVGGETDNLTFGAEGLGVTPEQEAMFLKEMRDNPRAVFLCAWKDGRLIGTGFLSGMTRRMAHRARLAICILKSEWGKGAGSAVMEELISFAREIGTEIIELEVRSDNSRAIHLYEKYGFRRIGTFPAFFRINDEYIDFELMYLDLR